MRIVAISDLHGETPWLPEGDVLLIIGDVTKNGDLIQLAKFDNYLANKKNIFKYILFTAGNHDFTLEQYPYLSNAKVYINEPVIVDGVRFWLSPYSLHFGSYVFTRKEYELKEMWDMIPENTDIVATHIPPLGIMDYSIDGDCNIGSRTLLWRIQDIKPKYHIFGHAHGHLGQYKQGDTTFVNVASKQVATVIDI